MAKNSSQMRRRHRDAVDRALFAEFHQIEEQRPRHLAQRCGGRGHRLRRRSGSARTATGAPVRIDHRPHWCEPQQPAGASGNDSQLDRQERSVIHSDSALFHRRDEKYRRLALMMEANSLTRPAGRSASSDKTRYRPRDSHVDFAAIGWIPQVHRRRALAGGGFTPGNAVESGGRVCPSFAIVRITLVKCDFLAARQLDRRIESPLGLNSVHSCDTE